MTEDEKHEAYGAMVHAMKQHEASIASDELEAIEKRLRAPAYWMCGSEEGHEGESDAPIKAADAIAQLRAEVERLMRELENAKIGWSMSRDATGRSRRNGEEGWLS